MTSVQGQRVKGQGHIVNAHLSPKYPYIGNRGRWPHQRQCRNLDRKLGNSSFWRCAV